MFNGDHDPKIRYFTHGGGLVNSTKTCFYKNMIVNIIISRNGHIKHQAV